MTDSSGKERRRETRYDVRIDVDYAAADTYLFAKITDISSMGIFVTTPTPSPVGSRLALRFRPPTGASADSGDTSVAIEALGEVVWTSTEGEHAGMGIRFTDLDTPTRSRLIELVKAVAYLDGSP